MIKPLIWIVSLGAIGLALAVAFAGPGTQLGWWEYSTGLKIIREAARPLIFLTIGSAAAFVVSLIGARGIAPVPLVAVIVAGIATLVPLKMREAFEAKPFIHDITTDFSDPPTILAAADLERVNPPEYNGDEAVPRSSLTVAEAQRAGFPNIKPIETELSVEDAADRASQTIRDMGMKLLSDGPVEDGWVIEAAYKSAWFGFIDDFVVRVEPTRDGSRVDIRSKSRVGGSDLGANGARVLEFIERFNAEDSD